MSDVRLMIQPTIKKPQSAIGGSDLKPAVIGYEIVGVGGEEPIVISGPEGIPAYHPRFLEIAAMFAAAPDLVDAAREAISQIEHMAHQLGVKSGTGTGNATIDRLKKAIALSETPRFFFRDEGDEDIMRAKMEDATASGPRFAR